MERKHVARILLACLNGKMDSRGITACRSILHFIQLAQYPSHDKHTLQYMTNELNTWHTYKDYFVEKEARAHFKIPKFHSLLHYVDSIKWLGTTDNYNTEAFERLHIDLTKEGWHASNKRDYFPQMLSFISRQEKVLSFDFYKSWTSNNQESTEQLEASDSKQKSSSLGFEQEEEDKEEVLERTPEEEHSTALISLAKYPKEARKKIEAISLLHSTPGFSGALKLFLNDCLSPFHKLKKGDALKKRLPFTTLEVWHNFGLVPLEVLDPPPVAVGNGQLSPDVMRNEWNLIPPL
ncbi:hypothetical protein EV360DRAFT_86807 [Lentinula raphanica]|nr:hypothetical protein EV360DRAFT_86807 [Lentinula raphanica]